MNKPLWMALSLAFAAFFTSCSKDKGLSPEDTALIKGTDRGTFIGSAEDLAGLEGQGDTSPLGATITGLDGDDGLIPQDDFWSQSDFGDGERPFDPIFFGFDHYNIGAEERAKLQDIASYLNANPEARILVEGYCDWKGTPEYNKSLGDRRATTVKDYLVELGADEGRIDTVSIGDESALPNATGNEARLDRRAAFVVTKGT